jgi:hypothetical protein
VSHRHRSHDGIAPPAVFRFADLGVSNEPSERLFYTGPVINTEMLVVMLEKHGIIARQELDDPQGSADDDLNRPAKVYVPSSDYDRAHSLFYVGREDEL